MAPSVPSCSRAPVALPGLFRQPWCCAGAAGAANRDRAGWAGLGPAMLRDTGSSTQGHTPFCAVRGIIACGLVGLHLITPSWVPACCVGAATARYVCVWFGPSPLYIHPQTRDIPVDKVMPSDARENLIQGPHEKCMDEHFPAQITGCIRDRELYLFPFPTNESRKCHPLKYC